MGKSDCGSGLSRACRGTATAPSPWLFSRRTDLLVFILPALVSLGLVGLGLATGIAAGDTPPILWLLAVLLVDVAHVWSTLYRVYTDPVELRRRPVLYWGAPLALFAVGLLLHLQGPLLFWRVLAYAAVFHFVRQQFGWMKLYRRRAKDVSRVGAWIDGAAIYGATLYPLLFWHAAAPRHFTWFVPGDFVLGLVPLWVARVGLWMYLAVLVAYAVRAVFQMARGELIPWGKHGLLATTAVCWWVGIVTFDSDYVFTVTNVLIHGIPYFALVWRYGQGRYAEERVAGGSPLLHGDAAVAVGRPLPQAEGAQVEVAQVEVAQAEMAQAEMAQDQEFQVQVAPTQAAHARVSHSEVAPAQAAQLSAPRWARAIFRRGWPFFYASLVALALAEELLWDKLVWHDHPQFFGAGGVSLSHLALAATVALLAVPQATHYLLDGFVWRGGRQNPGLAQRLGL